MNFILFYSRHTRKINRKFLYEDSLSVEQQRVEVFRVEDLATGLCGEVVFVPKGIIMFFQFIVNSGSRYNLSVVISIFYYSGLIEFAS